MTGDVYIMLGGSRNGMEMRIPDELPVFRVFVAQPLSALWTPGDEQPPDVPALTTEHYIRRRIGGKKDGKEYVRIVYVHDGVNPDTAFQLLREYLLAKWLMDSEVQPAEPQELEDAA